MASASHNKRFSSSLSMSLLRDMNANVGIMETPVRDNTQSRLPSYRGSDLAFAGRGFLSVTGCSALSLTASKKTLELDAENDDKRARAAPSSPLSPSSSPSISLSPPAPSGPGISRALGQIHHERSNPIDARIAEHADTDTPRRSRKMSLAPPKATTVASPPAVPLDATVNLTKTAKQHPPKGRNAGPPPPSMLNRGLLCEPSSSTSISPSDDGADSNSTNTWVVQQQIHSRTPSADQNPPVQSQDQHPEHDQDQQYRLARSQTEPAPARRSLIKPIRGFKLSSQRKSAEMASRRMSYNDSSLQALEGRGGSDNAYNALAHPDQQDEQNSDDSDLFLRAAREEELQAGNMNVDGPGRAARARAPSGPSMAFQQSPESRYGQRASLPPSYISNSVHPTVSRRRGSDHGESMNGVRSMDEQPDISQALTYQPGSRDRPTPLDDINRSRYNVVSSRSSPTTPRGSGGRDISPEQPTYGGRRFSIPDPNPLAPRSYRQSNLSYTTPRTYNSSPLVSRTTDIHEVNETHRAAEDTASTVSTTAPSTVWDELEDLKSRIHRLELTGKLPPSSGAAMSRVSHDRPPTATTTVTTISSSPKQREPGNSISPVDSVAPSNHAEAHPLLHAALKKSQHLLSLDVYKTLEATAADALAISSMLGVSGQPGPISSSQSTAGGIPLVTDRQVRRKADSMCRSLTELCLALSESQAETSPPATSQAVVRPASRDSRDTEVRASIESPNTQRQMVTTDLARVKSSPRALSHLEARRSSLLATSSLSSPRYAPSEAVTSPQSALGGRRASLLLRPRRAATEEPEEEDEPRLRMPSRATTDLGRTRQPAREYTSSQPLPERTERASFSQPAQSSLPVRRHYQSSSLTNTNSTPKPPVTVLGGRRFLDRATPERDTTSVAGRLAEDREQRSSPMGYGNLPLSRNSSLQRRPRQPSSVDYSAGQPRDYD